MSERRMPLVQGPVVLVIEDDPAVLNSLKFSLQIEGFSVRVYESGLDLLGCGDLPSAGCLVIDFRLPGMDGLDLLRRLRARGVAMPAILITTSPGTALRERARAAGIHRIVEKPLLGNTLTDSIREALGGAALAAV